MQRQQLLCDRQQFQRDQLKAAEVRSLASPTLQPQTPLQLPPILRAPPLPHRSPPTVKSPKSSSTGTEDKPVGHSGDKPAEPVDQVGHSGEKPVDQVGQRGDKPVDQHQNAELPTEDKDKSSEDKQAEPVIQDSKPPDAMATDADTETMSSGPETATTEQGGEKSHDVETKHEGEGGDGKAKADGESESEGKRTFGCVFSVLW